MSESVAAILERRVRETPDAPFLIDPDGTALTYAAVAARARGLAGWLAAQGIAPGESVAWAMPNGPDSALCLLGILRGGYLATAINLVAGRDIIAYVLDHSDARIVFVDAGTEAPIREALAQSESDARVVVIGRDIPRPGPDPGPVRVEKDPGSGPGQGIAPGGTDGLLMYTSGTTGRPKGVVLTQASLVAGGANPALAHGLTAGDRALCTLPLYHINGLCVTIMGPLVSGGSVVLPPKFSVKSFWATLRARGCTWFSVVPTQISYLLHDETPFETIPALRFGRSASAPLSPDVQTAFEGRFGVPIIETMGLTETAAQILSNPLPPGLRKIGSPGTAIGNEVVIADTAQRELPRGEEGEVLVRGANVMRLYRKNPQATAEALTPDGWLRTGDLGRMDAEGYVTITGRLKELIIKGGENIAPREVDEALYTHADVIEAAAFACPCDRYGQRIEAGVMLSAGSTATEGALIALCVERIGPFKAPDRVHVLPELPKGPSGKIQRIKLAALVLGG